MAPIEQNKPGNQNQLKLAHGRQSSSTAKSFSIDIEGHYKILKLIVDNLKAWSGLKGSNWLNIKGYFPLVSFISKFDLLSQLAKATSSGIEYSTKVFGLPVQESWGFRREQSLRYAYSDDASEEFDKEDTLTLIKPFLLTTKDVRSPFELRSVESGNGLSHGDHEEDKTE
ncbi:Transmembrane protein like [Forsythia ovata]|uniref:Transmembrane protein like n=1 Tax=Forsythia ovata TaxID=205694 RepID=A0ABD1WPV3_9LAMI